MMSPTQLGLDSLSDDDNGRALMSVRGLSKTFEMSKHRSVAAVNDVSFTIISGETLALVGESGCGKSTVARLLLGLLEPSSGTVTFQSGEPNSTDDSSESSHQSNVHAVFQDSYSSLNPRMSILDSIIEPLKIAREGTRQSRDARGLELLELVGLTRKDSGRFPHQLSGGQRQRVGIARALVRNPKLVILDEPVSALDLSVQAQIVNLLESLQAKLNLSYLFISHDLNVVRGISNRVAVMYLGRIVEIGLTRDVFGHPMHPYTKALLSATLSADPDRARKVLPPVDGDPPSPMDIPAGCSFHPRCPIATQLCSEVRPRLEIKSRQTKAACHFPDIAGT